MKDFRRKRNEVRKEKIFSVSFLFQLSPTISHLCSTEVRATSVPRGLFYLIDIFNFRRWGICTETEYHTTKFRLGKKRRKIMTEISK